MNFSESISRKFSEVIAKELDYQEDNKEILTYAIETMVLFILGVLVLTIIGILTNALFPIIIAASFGGLLRRFSGGAHFNTPLKCLAFGSIVYISIGIIAQKIIHYEWNNRYTLLLLLLVSFFIVAYLAPVDSESKPIHSRSLKLKLKIAATGFVLISLILVFLTNNKLLAVSVVLGTLYQSLTLLPIFNKKGGVKL